VASIVSRKGSVRAGLSAHIITIAFVLFVLMAGVNPVAVRFSNRELPPLWGAASRFAVASVIAWAIVLVRRIALPRGRALLGAVLYGTVGIGSAYAFIYWALVRVQPGTASIFLGSVPLVTVFLAAGQGLEPLTWRRVAGALLAVGGIVLVVSGKLGTGLAVPVLLALIAFPFAMAEGAVIIKRSPAAQPAATNAISLSVGTVILAAGSLLTGEAWSLPSATATWAAFGYLVVFGTLGVFYLWLYILARWPATRSAYGMVLMPMVTIVISVWLTGEVITPSFLVGGALALAGVWLGAISHIGERRHPVAPKPVAAPEIAPGTDLADCAPNC
jgi:drug/metabolite transporter (DMT)-like permease